MRLWPLIYSLSALHIMFFYCVSFVYDIHAKHISKACGKHKAHSDNNNDNNFICRAAHSAWQRTANVTQREGTGDLKISKATKKQLKNIMKMAYSIVQGQVLG